MFESTERILQRKEFDFVERQRDTRRENYETNKFYSQRASGKKTELCCFVHDTQDTQDDNNIDNESFANEVIEGLFKENKELEDRVSRLKERLKFQCKKNKRIKWEDDNIKTWEENDDWQDDKWNF